MNGLTVEEISRRNLLPSLVEPLLLDEERRGNVEQRDGRWQATETLVARFGSAFAYLAPPANPERRRGT